MNNVVEKLRGAANEQSGHEWPELVEAADEIERLKTKQERITKITMLEDTPDAEKINLIIFVLANA
ncbi:MAG: hypothetical protein KAI73_07690 [Rhodospirillaceae bacterium]|nr:hypothetical protein [Rhodospirillaceae bacterium]